MIHSFSCKNFYSFKEEAILNFVVNNHAPENDGYIHTAAGVRLSKVENVIGSNASGKTNLLKVVPFVKWFLLESFGNKPDEAIAFQPFAFGASANQPTEFSVTFEANAKVYTYHLVLNIQKVISEELSAVSYVKEKKGNKTLFVRKWDESKLEYSLEDINFDLPKGFEQLIRSNVSLISAAARLNHKESLELSKYWEDIETNVIESGWMGDRWFNTAYAQLGHAFQFFSENTTLKEEAEKLLCRFDLGLHGFEIEKKTKENDTFFSVRAAHLFNDQKHYLPIQYESAGTRQLMVLLKHILTALDKGSFVVIDEFDVNLHPEMVLALFNFFVNPDTNPKNAQLLLSTHTHLLLTKLDKYQITLVEKNDEGFSETWRLDDMGDSVRSDDNYYAKYIAGTYGAVPKL
jgi:AAA15 family ATPase/GTPase